MTVDHKLSPAYRPLLDLVRQCWACETSTNRYEWTPKKPALGQSAATAGLVRAIYGGKIRFDYAHTPEQPNYRIGHYLNIIEGETVDLSNEGLPTHAILEPARRQPGPIETSFEGRDTTNKLILRYNELVGDFNRTNGTNLPENIPAMAYVNPIPAWGNPSPS